VWRLPFWSASAGLLLVAGMAGVSARRGAELYRGKEALSGQIRGQDDALPPQVLRCANCHSAKSSAQLPAPAAPRIDSALLLELRQRRGGPPSRYDQAAFCRLLRTGSDPAFILIAREMPTYEVSDEQCASLWIFLTGKEMAHEYR
jgi:hypothetical protein